MRSVLRISGIVLAVAAALVLALRLVQRRLLYFPFGVPGEIAASGLADARDVEIETEDGLRLHAWHVPAAGVATPRAAVLVLPGNAGHRGDRAAIAAGLSRRGFAVLLLDYRGYGGNPGRPSEQGLARDARAARRYWLEREGIDPSRLIYFGESLGAAVALGLAAEAEPRVLVLRSPFSTLAEVAHAHYPFLPVSLVLVERYPSLERAAKLRCPVLVFAGDQDRVVPVEQSRAIASALGQTDVRLVVLPGADHGDPELVAGERLFDAIDRLWHDTAEAQGGER
jgi:alpha-beta hydrolase superfamily lysophospholipase